MSTKKINTVIKIKNYIIQNINIKNEIQILDWGCSQPPRLVTRPNNLSAKNCSWSPVGRNKGGDGLWPPR
jgi:hypothetical protein